MICDDEPDILEMTGMLLEIEDFEVSTQVNSGHLIEQAIQEQPDLLLLDLWMPFLPGDQLARNIRNTPELAHIPIIIFSAAPDGKTKAEAAGADGFIAKPFDGNNLVKLIQSILQQSVK